MLILGHVAGKKRANFMPGSLDTVAQLVVTITRKVDGLSHFSFREIKSSGKYEIFQGKYERITFSSEEISSTIGFKKIPGGNGNHIVYKTNPNANKPMKSNETKAYCGVFAANFCAEKHLIFFYTNKIESQYVGDTKAPLLRIIDSKQRLKNGSVCELEPTHRIIFTKLYYKKLFTIQSISSELRTETGQLVPFFGTGKLLSHNNSKTFPNKMDSFYAHQETSLPHFPGHHRKKRESSFYASAAGIGRAVLPLARRFNF